MSNSMKLRFGIPMEYHDDLCIRLFLDGILTIISVNWSITEQNDQKLSRRASQTSKDSMELSNNPKHVVYD